MNTKPADDVKLLPCPFCGTQAEISEGTQGGEAMRPWYYVECCGCSASGESVEAWNLRAPRSEKSRSEQYPNQTDGTNTWCGKCGAER